MADVITLIEQDHRKVEQVFSQLQGGGGDRHQLVATLEQLLVPHTEAEEAAVYPAIQREDVEPFDRQEADGEHDEASKLLLELKDAIDDDARFETLLGRLVEAVQHHVEEEEQEIFPAFRRKVDGGVLDQLGQAFETAKQERLKQLTVITAMTRVTGTPGAMATASSPDTVETTDVTDLTKAELYELAKEQDVEGRSKMTKDELARAVAGRR